MLPERGMVNVSSRFRHSLPERTRQKRKSLTSLFRLCRGLYHARFSRRQGYGANATRSSTRQICFLHPQREPGANCQNSWLSRLERIGRKDSGEPADRDVGASYYIYSSGSGHPHFSYAGSRAVSTHDRADLRGARQNPARRGMRHFSCPRDRVSAFAGARKVFGRIWLSRAALRCQRCSAAARRTWSADWVASMGGH